MTYDVERIMLELDLIGHTGVEGQLMLQTVKGCDDPNYGVGRSTTLNHKEDEFTVPLYDIPYLNSIIEELNLFRARVMFMAPRSCYTYHQDLTDRVHIPLETNPHAFFIVDDELLKMDKEGQLYFLHATKPHTAINAHKTDVRIHFVGLTHEREQYW